MGHWRDSACLESDKGGGVLLDDLLRVHEEVKIVENYILRRLRMLQAECGRGRSRACTPMFHCPQEEQSLREWNIGRGNGERRFSAALVSKLPVSPFRSRR